MAKNIVILFDGTSNDVSEHRTNILRLYGALEKGPRQVVWYTPGVGTIGAENAWSRNYRKALELWGAATGWLLDLNVKNAYRFLVANYYNGKPDRWSKGRLRGPVAVPLTEDARDAIWIFGFSRGAYSARVLAGFIHAVGLIHPDNLNLLDAAFAAYKRAGDRLFSPDAALAGEDFGEVRLFERILAPDRPPSAALACSIPWRRSSNGGASGPGCAGILSCRPMSACSRCAMRWRCMNAAHSTGRFPGRRVVNSGAIPLPPAAPCRRM